MQNEYEAGQYEEDTMKDRYLTFLIDKDVYALALEYVVEIIGIQEITEVPELPKYIRGVMNLRGRIIPLMDVRLRFEKTFKDYDERTCIVIIDYEKIAIGLIVDTVSDIITMTEADIMKTPEIGRAVDMRFVRKIGKIGGSVKLILDCRNLLTLEEEAMVEQLQG